MSRIINVVPNDDYTLLIEFEYGNKIIFNMHELVCTLPYARLKDLDNFKRITFEDKTILWKDDMDSKVCYMPVKLTTDNILFMIRD